MRNYKQDAAQYNPNKYDQTPTPDNGLNMHIPVSGDEYKSTPEQRAAARKTVAANALDAGDATELMKMLGLIQ